MCFPFVIIFFFFNDTATTEIYTLSLHDALPICSRPNVRCGCERRCVAKYFARSEEHTSELQSLRHLVCRLLLEKKKRTKHINACALLQITAALTRPGPPCI